MNTKSEYLLDKIYEKLKNIKEKNINLEKNEFKRFIHHLMKSS